MNDDIKVISEKNFNYDLLSIQTTSKVILSKKLYKIIIGPCQKHLSDVLDRRLNFDEQLKVVINKTKMLLHKLLNILPRVALLSYIKSYIKSLPDLIWTK